MEIGLFGLHKDIVNKYLINAHIREGWWLSQKEKSFFLLRKPKIGKYIDLMMQHETVKEENVLFERVLSVRLCVCMYVCVCVYVCVCTYIHA